MGGPADPRRATHSEVGVTPATGFTLIAFPDPDDIELELYLATGASAG